MGDHVPHAAVIPAGTDVLSHFTLRICEGCDFGCTGKKDNVHCPLCPTSKFKPKFIYRVKTHLVKHFKGNFQGSVETCGFRVTLCHPKLCDQQRNNKTHYHCPFCTKVFVKKCNLLSHNVKCRSVGCSPADEVTPRQTETTLKTGSDCDTLTVDGNAIVDSGSQGEVVSKEDFIEQHVGATVTISTTRKNVRKKCTTCGHEYHPKYMPDHIRRIHDPDRPPRIIDEKRHHFAVCVDPSRGIYSVARSLRSTPHPIHVLNKITGLTSQCACELADCNDLMEAEHRGGNPSFQCDHILSTKFSVPSQPSDLNLGYLQQIMDEGTMDDGLLQQCTDLHCQAANEGTPLLVEIPHRANCSKRYLFFSIFTACKARWAEFERTVVTIDTETLVMFCRCHSVSCEHQAVVHWWLYQQGQTLDTLRVEDDPDEDIICDGDTNESDSEMVEDLDDIVEDPDETPEAVCTSPVLPPRLPNIRDIVEDIDEIMDDPDETPEAVYTSPALLRHLPDIGDDPPNVTILENVNSTDHPYWMLKEHRSSSPDTRCDDNANESDLDRVEDVDDIVEDPDETPEAVYPSPALPPQLQDIRDDPLNITNLDTAGVCKSTDWMLKEHSSKSPDTSDKRNDAPASDEDIGCDDDTNESDLDTVEDLDEIVEDLDETPEAVCTSPALPPQLPDTRDDPLNITNLDTYGSTDWMLKEHSSKNADTSAKRNDGCRASAAMCEENCHHTSGSPVASNAYTLQIPLTLVANWLELPGLPVTRISGKNQDGREIGISLSHSRDMINVSVLGGVHSPFKSTEVGWVCRMTSDPIPNEVKKQSKTNSSSEYCHSSLGGDKVVEFQLPSEHGEMARMEISQCDPAVISNTVTVPSTQDLCVNWVTDSNTSCIEKSVECLETFPFFEVEVQTEPAPNPHTHCSDITPDGSTDEQENMSRCGSSKGAINILMTGETSKQDHTYMCDMACATENIDSSMADIAKHAKSETGAATDTPRSTSVDVRKCQLLCINRMQLLDPSSEMETATQSLWTSTSSEHGVQNKENCAKSNCNWSNPGQRHEVKYDIRESEKHNARSKPFLQTKVIAQKCIICGKLLKSISALQCHAGSSHQVNYRDYCKVVLALNFQTNVQNNISSHTKAKKLGTLSPTQALKLLERWKKRGRKLQKPQWLLLECPVCKKKFGNSRNFQQHMANMHPSVKLRNFEKSLGSHKPEAFDYHQLVTFNEALLLKTMKKKKIR